MNARPITTVPTNAEDIEPLTPNQFLLGRTHASFPLLPLEPFLPERQWKFAQQLTNHIWKRLMKEFLPTLLPRQQWTKKTARIDNGQPVWILEDMTPRGLWPIGKIIKAMPSPDDQTRIYQVKTRRGLETIPAIRIAPIIPMDSEHSGSPAGEDRRQGRTTSSN